jgi:hypothetical protein
LEKGKAGNRQDATRRKVNFMRRKKVIVTAVIYLRTSSEEQVADPHGLKAQLRNCVKWCLDQGWDVKQSLNTRDCGEKEAI